jgi:hypothetical protein
MVGADKKVRKKNNLALQRHRMVKIGRASGHLSLEAGAAGEASDDEDGRLRDKSGAPSIEGTTCSAQHSPLGLAMMLKAGWKPWQALGRDPGIHQNKQLCSFTYFQALEILNTRSVFFLVQCSFLLKLWFVQSSLKLCFRFFLKCV